MASLVAGTISLHSTPGNPRATFDGKGVGEREVRLWTGHKAERDLRRLVNGRTFISVRERQWWCQWHDVNPSWPLQPRTERDFQGFVSPYVKRDAVACVTSWNSCVRWPGWHLKGPAYFLLTTKQSWNTITTLTGNSPGKMAPTISFTWPLLHCVNQVFCFQGTLSHMISDHSPGFVLFFSLSTFSHKFRGQSNLPFLSLVQ